MNTLTETCACGSTFTYVGRYASDVGAAVRSWRETHKHAEGVGICGNTPPPIMLGDVELPRPYCQLKAGHAGMHSDGEGHWMEAPQSGPESATGAPSSTSRVSADVEGGDEA